MTISSRTPEGSPNLCPVCGAQVRIEASAPQGDGPCPSCGHLLWFSCTGLEAIQAIPRTDGTCILSEIDRGDPKAAEQLLPLVYDELRKLAELKLAQEKPGQTLQATALVHEAYVRLMNVNDAGEWSSR